MPLSSDRPRRARSVVYPAVILCALLAGSPLLAGPGPVEGGSEPPGGEPVAPTPVAPPLKGRHGLYFSVGLLSGNHTPELEERFRNDRFFGALFVGGFAGTSEWQNTAGVALPIEVRYHWGRFQVGVESVSFGSEPGYAGFVSLNTTVSGTPVALSAIDSTQYAALIRSSTDVFGGYLLNPNSNFAVSALLGLRSFGLNGEYSVSRLTSISSSLGSAQQLELTNGAEIDAGAVGVLLGAELLAPLADRINLRGRLLLFAGNGSWRHDFLVLKGSAGGASAEVLREDGIYNVRAYQLDVAAYYEVAVNRSVYVRLRAESAITRDSEVAALKFSTVASENFTAARQTEFLLTYPGSQQTDQLVGFEVGFEGRLALQD